MSRDRIGLRPISEPRAWAASLLALNLVLSLVFCFVISPRLIGSGVTLLDPDGYGRAGRTLYQTGRFDSIEKAPLYPAFVALISCLTGGYHVWAIQAAQCLLAALTCVLLFLIFERVLGKETAPWAGLACALHPILIWYTPRMWTEVFLTFVLAGFTLALIELLRRPTAWRASLCGILVGILVLSKGIALIFVLLIPLVLVIHFRRKSWRWLLIFCLSAAVLILPWTYRNWRLTGQFVPIHADGGFNFYLGNGFARHWLQAPLSYTALKAHTVQDMEWVYASQAIAPPGDPLEVDRILLRAALADMRAHPLLLPQKLAVQSLTFWYLAADAPKSLLTGGLQIPVVLVASLGLIRALHRRSWALALLIPIGGIMGVSVIVFAFARLSATIMPYVIGLAVYGLWPRIEESRYYRRIL